MKTLLRVIKWLAMSVCVAGAAIAAYVAYTWNRTYDAPLPALSARADEATIKRGEYLVYGPAHCAACHTPPLAETPETAGNELTPLSGGRAFPLGPLGIVYSRNLTPDVETGIGRYTDGQIARQLRHGVRPDGKATISAMMPYGDMGDDDIIAIISFLRAQKPVKHVVPESRFTLIGKIVKSFAPAAKPRLLVNPPATAPAAEPTRARGEYLARNVANCIGCHTPRDPLAYLPTGPEFSGGQEMEADRGPDVEPATWFRTPNLTPAKGSALMKFPDRATFVARFQRGGRQHPGSPMPWESFARLSEQDAGALYEYLMSLPAASGPTGEPKFKKQ